MACSTNTSFPNTSIIRITSINNEGLPVDHSVGFDRLDVVSIDAAVVVADPVINLSLAIISIASEETHEVPELAPYVHIYPLSTINVSLFGSPDFTYIQHYTLRPQEITSKELVPAPVSTYIPYQNISPLSTPDGSVNSPLVYQDGDRTTSGALVISIPSINAITDIFTERDFWEIILPNSSYPQYITFPEEPASTDVCHPVASYNYEAGLAAFILGDVTSSFPNGESVDYEVIFKDSNGDQIDLTQAPYNYEFPVAIVNFGVYNSGIFFDGTWTIIETDYYGPQLNTTDAPTICVTDNWIDFGGGEV